MISIRVLMLVPDLFRAPGGIARYNQAVYRVLREAGVDVTVVALWDSTGNEPPGTGKYFPCGGSHVRFVWRSLRCLASRPTVILTGHVHLAAVGWFLAVVGRARHLIFIYGIDVWDRIRGFRGHALRTADRIIAISEYTVRRASKVNQLPAHRIRIIPPCLDPSFVPVQRGKRERDELLLLTVSRIERSEAYKGHDAVVRALPALLERFPNVRYDVVGDGDGRADIERLVRELQLEHIVRFHGRVSEEELRRRYAEADLYVMPSNSEGFGIVFVEAMASGLPVVASNQDATPEAVDDGETGILVDPASSTELSAALGSLLSDDTRRLDMSLKAVRRVQDRFSFHRFKSQLVDCLAELSIASGAE